MARPIKQGLEYFPLDVDLDNKMELIEAKFGLNGFGIIIKLLQCIYKEGYFLDISEEINLLLGKRFNVDFSLLTDVINYSINHGIFDKTKYETYKILTSNGIQKRYLKATGRREKVELIKEYIICDDINKENVFIKSINVDINLQSKEKKRREYLIERDDKLLKVNILRKFHEKRFYNVLYEYERFITHYQKTSWLDSNGNKITDKFSAAVSWEEKPYQRKLSLTRKLSPFSEVWYNMVTDYLISVTSEEEATLIFKMKVMNYENSKIKVCFDSDKDYQVLQKKCIKKFKTSFRKFFHEPIDIEYYSK